MTDTQVEDIKGSVSVPSILEALEIELPARIPGHILCRFHAEATPSLWIAESRWWCFGCGQGGDVVDLVRHVTGCSFPQALRFLEGMGDLLDFKTPVIERTERKVVDLTDTYYAEYSGSLAFNHDAVAFIKGRWPHLPLKDLERWGVAVGGRGRYLMIPHYTNGVITGIKTRTLAGPNKGEKKAFTGSTYGELYKVELRPQALDLVLVEGESDTWTLTLTNEARPDVQIAGLPSGAQSWRRYLPEMRKYGSVAIALDNDETGNRVSDEIQAELGHYSFRSKPPFSHKDWCEAAEARHV